MAQYFPNIQFQIVDSTTASVTGELDVKSTTDFPLALTYSIKDVQDPQSSQGSFSKTFKIPATKTNNEILKSLYSDSLFQAFQYIEDKDAQIFIDGMLVLQGKFQIKGTEYQGTPKYYECVVFGDNFKWVNQMADLNLCDLDFDAGNFFPDAPSTASFGRQAIMDTWEFGLAGEVVDFGGTDLQTHIVYPLINNGKWTYGDFVAPADMTPAFYIYNIIKVMFAGQGYTVNSTFFETDWFKRQVSLLPKQEFVNTEANILNWSFEYENGVATAWKSPLDYANQSGIPNDCSAAGGQAFDGAIQNQSLVCPTCDPETLITSQTITPFFNIDTPMNMGGLGSTEEPTLAGWYWGRYGTANTTQARLPFWLPNNCAPPPNAYVGHDFGCVVCIGAGATPPFNTYIETMTADVFQTTFLGEYQFNGKVRVEMNNDYEINDPVSAYDSGALPGGGGTFEGGDGLMCYGSQTYEGNTETEWNGVTYICNLYLIHYKEETDSFHTIHVGSERLYNDENDALITGNYQYCGSYQLPASPNLTFKVQYANVMLDILSAGDKVFQYVEVTAERWHMEDTGYSASNQVILLCQMKYRVLSSAFNGGLTPNIIEGGSVDIASLLPCDVSQLDWVNGLTGMFNLFWQSDEVAKTITVEPRDWFFNSPTTAVDWTDKLDKGKLEHSKYIYDALKRKLCFTYEDDGADVFVEERNRRRGQKCSLNSHVMDLGELYENDDQKIGTEFYSPTYMFYDRTISNNMGAYKQPFIPVIHGEYTAIWNVSNWTLLPEKVFDFAPRILIWYGKQPLNQEDGLTSNNTWRWGYDGNSNYPSDLQYYPFAGVYSDQVGDLGGTLTFGGTTYDAPTLAFDTQEVNSVTTAPPYETTNGLYEMFWKFNILTLLDRPKIKTAYFKLTPNDIAELDFRNLIFIQSAQSDTYWILNKIIDYKGSKNELTKVELFEFHNAEPLDLFNTTQGFGEDTTQFWTDFPTILVNNGTVLVPQKSLQTNLGIYNMNQNTLKTQGVQTNLYAKRKFIGKIKPAITNRYTDDGTRVPINSTLKQSSNIGNNSNLNIGSISIGNEQNVSNPNQIIIGSANNPISNRNIELTSNGITAASIGTDGVFREGGGGAVYYEDPSGNIKEVITGIPKFHVLNGTTTYFYTRVVKGNENITL